METATYFSRDLPGGARLVGETVPGRRSVALGVWLRTGSRDEDPGREGMAHFIEHLVFKGSRNRTGKEIAASLERVGGSLDAFTTKDTTCFHARVLEEHVDLAVDVLADLVSHPRFASADVDTERDVVLEEIRSVEDAPEDLIGDLAMRHLWPDDIMGASILGTQESLAGIAPEHVRDFHQRLYRAPRMVVSAAGAVEPDRMAALLSEKMVLSNGPEAGPRPSPEPSLSSLTLYPEDLAQLYLSLAVPAPSDRDPRRRATHLLVDIFGGGMSSRLFQSVREEAGLAYSVYAYSEHFEDTGIFGTGLAVNPGRAREALDLTLAEMRLLVRDGLRPGELDAAHAQVRGSLLMGMESLTNRMTRAARGEFRSGTREPAEKVLAEYEAVTEQDVLAVAEELLAPERQNLVALGPVKAGDLDVLPFQRVGQAGE